MSATGDETAAARECAQAALPGGLADMFEHHVHAAAAGPFAHLVRPRRIAVVDGKLRAHVERLAHLVVAACGGDHAGTGQCGDLHSDHADAGACRDDQHVLADADVGAPAQHVPGRGAGHRRGGGLRIGQRIRQAQQLFGGCKHPLGVSTRGLHAEHPAACAHIGRAAQAGCTFATAQDGVQHHPIADRPLGDSGTDLDHVTCHFGARDMRHRWCLRRLSISREQVHLVQPTSPHGQQHLADTRCGYRHVLVQPQFGLAVADLVQTHGAHGGFHFLPFLKLFR